MKRHYRVLLLQFGLLLLKNHGLFLRTRYPHFQAAILRGTLHRFFRGRDSMKGCKENRRFVFATIPA